VKKNTEITSIITQPTTDSATIEEYNRRGDERPTTLMEGEEAVYLMGTQDKMHPPRGMPGVVTNIRTECNSGDKKQLINSSPRNDT
jgi:hypothetical protein